jgi:gas vesicle protein
MNKILITLAAGIGLGLLLAPGKGSETWKKLKDGFNDLKDDATDKAADLAIAGKKVLKSGRSRLESEIN